MEDNEELNIRISKELKVRLDAFTKKFGKEINATIQEALEYYLSSLEDVDYLIFDEICKNDELIELEKDISHEYMERGYKVGKIQLNQVQYEFNVYINGQIKSVIMLQKLGSEKGILLLEK